MKLTQAHIDYWLAKRGGLPAWHKQVKRPSSVPSVHQLINSQTPRQGRVSEPHNTLAIVRSKLARGETLVEALTALRGLSSISGLRRVRYCQKWLSKIEGSGVRGS